MKLHYAEVLNPRKVCALAKHLGAPVDYIHVNLAKGEHQSEAFRAKNPNAKVPLLEDGDLMLWESDAILCHLARRMGSDIWPSGNAQVEVIRWLSWNNIHLRPPGGTLFFQNVVKRMFRAGEADAAKVAVAKTDFCAVAQVLERHLDGRETLVGEGWTIADFAVAGVMPYAEQAELPLDGFPRIRAWAARLNTLPAWRDPFPARG